jgi:serine/threonine-protein kinase
MGSYGQQPPQDPYGRTMAMPQQAPAGQTSILPGVGQGYDVGGDGFDDGSSGYDDGAAYGGRSDRRRAANGGGRNRNTSVIWLVVAAVLVLAGAFFVTKSLLGGSANNSISAPSLVGQSLTEAQASITNLGHNLRVVKGDSTACDPNKAQKGQVCTQDPPAGTTLQDGATITVHMSTGAPTKAVPNLKGQNYKDAEQALQSAGFVVGTEDRKSSDTVAKDTVISYSPSGQQPAGATINLVISSGQDMKQIPYVVGQSQNDAETQLKGAGFQVAVQVASSHDSRFPDNYVVAEVYQNQQLADGNTTAPSQSVVTILINPPDQSNTNQGQTGGQPTDTSSPSTGFIGGMTGGNGNGNGNGGNGG